MTGPGPDRGCRRALNLTPSRPAAGTSPRARPRPRPASRTRSRSRTRRALALVDLRLGGPSAATGDERYAIPFVAPRRAPSARRPRATGPGARSPWPSPRAARSRRSRRRRRAPGLDAALVCRPSPGFGATWRGTEAELADADERPLGRDQSNTSVVLGDALLLKAYRRIQPGLNPDLELTAYLSEEAGVPRRPAPGRLGGGRHPRRRRRHGGDAPGVRRRRGGRVRDAWPSRLAAPSIAGAGQP